MSNLPTLLLFIAVAVVCCSGHLVRDSKDVMRRRHCTWSGCYPASTISRNRWSRSTPEELPATTVLYSDLPSDKILQEVTSQYASKDEEAQIIQNENREVDNNRNKRGVRATVIRICNRRNGLCRTIVVYRRY